MVGLLGASVVGFELSDGRKVGAAVVVGFIVGDSVGIDVLGRLVGCDVG